MSLAGPAQAPQINIDGGIREMAISCEDKYKTPVPEDRKCPVCGKDIEVFVVKGRVVEDAECECGHVIKAEEPEV